MLAIERLEAWLELSRTKPALFPITVLQAIKRFRKDINSSSIFFDKPLFEKVVDFLESFCVYTSGRKKGKPIYLEPFQLFFLANLTALYDTDSKERHFSFAYLSVPRKNAKSDLDAYIVLVEMFLFQSYDYKGYCVANTEKQARIVFSRVRSFIKASPKLRHYVQSGFVELLASEIRILEKEIAFAPVASESSSLDGLNGQTYIMDEAHEYPDATLYNVLKNSMGNIPNQLLIISTTAGFKTNGFCFSHEQYCKNVLAGKEVNDKLFALIYTPDQDDDIHDEKVWYKVNPMLGIAIDFKVFKSIYEEGKTDPAKFVDFAVKRMNVWSNGEGRWLAVKDYKDAFIPMNRKDYEGNTGFASVDIGLVDDLFCRCLAFHKGAEIHVLFDIYISEESIKHRQQFESVHWKKWIKDGLVHVHPGRIVNEDLAVKDLVTDAAIYEIRDLAFDPWGAAAFTEKVKRKLKINAFVTRQGGMLTPHIRNFRELLLAGNLKFENNDVAKWCFGNAVIIVNGKTLKLDKGADASQKIDPLIAAVMAVYRASCNEHDDEQTDWSKFSI